jgi:hypothetical protein
MPIPKAVFLGVNSTGTLKLLLWFLEPFYFYSFSIHFFSLDFNNITHAHIYNLDIRI